MAVGDDEGILGLCAATAQQRAGTRTQSGGERSSAHAAGSLQTQPSLTVGVLGGQDGGGQAAAQDVIRQRGQTRQDARTRHDIKLQHASPAQSFFWAVANRNRIIRGVVVGPLRPGCGAHRHVLVDVL